jgi:hypothetical protein
MSSSVAARNLHNSREKQIGVFADKILSFPVFLGSLLVAGVYWGWLGKLQEAPSTQTFTTPWLSTDTWWHLAAATRILKTHTWPTHDTYSFTTFHSPWIDYGWLGDVCMALFWKYGGLQGLLIFVTILGGTVMVLLYYHASIRNRNPKAAFVACTLLLPLATLQFTTRPQLLGYAFLIVTLIALENFRQGHSRALWLLPLVFWFWVNTHGTFVLGFLILGVYWICGLRQFERGRVYSIQWKPGQRLQLELVLLLCVIASLLTPYGTRLVAYPIGMAIFQHLVVQFAWEWMPVPVSLWIGKLFLILLVLFWLGFAASRLKFRLEDLVLLTFATAETFLHARFLILFVPIFALSAADLLAQWMPSYQPDKDHRALNFALIVLIAFGALKFFPSSQQISSRLEYEVPVNAGRYFREHAQTARIFSTVDWGSYLIFALEPAQRVFIDGRLDIFEHNGVLADYLLISQTSPNTFFLLKKYGINFCLIPRDWRLATLLAASSEWKEIYHDRLSVIFARTQSAGKTGGDVQSAGRKGHASNRSGRSKPEPAV